VLLAVADGCSELGPCWAAALPCWISGLRRKTAVSAITTTAAAAPANTPIFLRDLGFSSQSECVGVVGVT
jgi:hypothetical protein